MARQLYSPEAEQAVLGSMLSQPDEVIEEVMAAEVDKDFFFVPSNQIVFKAIMGTYGDGEPVEVMIIHQWLADKGYADEVGSPGILAELLTSFANHLNVGSYIRILREKKTLRDLAEEAKARIKDILAMPDSVASVLDRAEKGLGDILERASVRVESDFGMEIQEASLSIFDHADKGGGMQGLPTGFKKMDELTLGWMPGELIVLGARPGKGKSALMLKNIIAVAGGQFNPDNGNYELPGAPVDVITLEMTRDEMYQRLFSIMSGVSLNDIMLGNLGEAARAKISAARDTMSTWPLSIEDEPHMDIDLLRARAKRMKRTKGIVALFVDYLQLLQSRKYARDRVNEVAYVTRMLKRIAMENGIPVIALAQLNRKDADKEEVEPHISHLKESGEIEQSANKVILLHQHSASSEAHRKRAPKPGVVCCTAIAAKQRNGKMGRVDLDFHAYRVTFESADEWGTGK